MKIESENGEESLSAFLKLLATEKMHSFGSLDHFPSTVEEA